MSKCKGLLHFVPSTRIKPKINTLQNVRWATVISAHKDSFFDDEALKAAKPFEEIPTLKILPWIGTAWVFLPIIGRYDATKLHIAMFDKRRLLGDIYRETLGSRNFVISFNPDDLETMYKHEGPYPQRTELESIKAYRESRKDLYKNLGLIVSQGKEWHDLRTKTQKHLMKPKAIQAFLSPMQDVARDFTQNITKLRDPAKEVPNLLGELYKWSLESVALVGLDARLGCLEKDLSPDSDGMKMIDSVQTQFDCINNLEAFSGNLQFWKYFPTPTWKKFTKASDAFAEIAFKHVNRSLEKLKSEVDEDKDLTLLQSMLMTKGMDVSSAVVMVSDMLMAGIDTTSHTVAFFLYRMARNPDKQELLHQHLVSVLPKREDKITPATFNELKYLKACIKESQRLDPVAGAQIRNLDHDVIFSGYRIPTGTVVLVAIQGIFRDAKYFPNPDEYLPERWLEKDETFHPFAFLPFSFGTRSCIGRRLAELEIICLISEIIRNFRIEYHYEDIGMYTRLVNTPDKPLRFTFIER